MNCPQSKKTTSKRTLLAGVSVLICLLFVENINALWTASRPDGHAPIGVHAEHTHHKGEWMFGYKYFFTYSDRHLDGASEVPLSNILDNYIMTGKEMMMHMHMLEVMFATSHRLTLMLMGDLMFHNMSHAHAPGYGEDHAHNTSGLADLRFSGMYMFYNRNFQRMHAEIGFTLPTGNIDYFEGYNMQLGSGTADLISGLTWLAQRERTSFGAQASGQFSFYDNKNNYRLGERVNATAWTGYVVNDWFSPLFRIDFNHRGNIIGRDPRLDPSIDPARDPNMQGGQRLDAGLGLNFYVRQGSLRGVRFAFEGLLPLYQNLEGPQMATSFTGVFGIQYAF
ncbi:MAG: transporter [Balneolaceae bacterium]|nr:MAG: transporter [Balneolaceae bacterium]